MTAHNSDNVYELLEDILSELPAPLPKGSPELVRKFLGQGEPEDAFYSLIWDIGWNRIPLARKHLEKIDKAGQMLRLDKSEWPGLARLVEDPNAFGPPEPPVVAQANVIRYTSDELVVELKPWRAAEAVKRLLVEACAKVSDEDTEEAYAVTYTELCDMRDAIAEAKWRMSRLPELAERYHRDGTPRS